MNSDGSSIQIQGGSTSSLSFFLHTDIQHDINTRHTMLQEYISCTYSNPFEQSLEQQHPVPDHIHHSKAEQPFQADSTQKWIETCTSRFSQPQDATTLNISLSIQTNRPRQSILAYTTKWHPTIVCSDRCNAQKAHHAPAHATAAT